MEEIELIREFNKLTKGRFDYIRLSVVNFAIYKNTAEYVFIYPEDKHDEINQYRGEIEGHLMQLLISQFHTSIVLRQSHLDVVLFKPQLLEWIKSNNALSGDFFLLENIDVIKLDSRIQLSIKVTSIVYDYIKQSDLMKKLEKYLYYNYTDKFVIKLESIEMNEQEIQDMIDRDNMRASVNSQVLEDSSTQRAITVTNIRHLVGKECETDSANYIEDCKIPLDDVTLSGTLIDFQELTAKSTGKKFYKFILQDFTSSIPGIIFTTKASESIVPQLKVGDTVIMRGKVELDKFVGGKAVNFSPKDISYCDLPKDFKKNRLMMQVPEYYTTVRPKPYVEAIKEDIVEQNFLDLMSNTSMSSNDTKNTSSGTNGVLQANGGSSVSHSETSEKNIASVANTSTVVDHTEYVVFDTETTGLDENTCTIIEIAAVKIRDGKIVETFDTLIDPKVALPQIIIDITHITDQMLVGQPSLNEVLPDFFKFCDGATIVAHNIEFDYRFLSHHGKSQNIYFDHPQLDTLAIARQKVKGLKNYKLGTICTHFGIINDAAHRALSDTVATAKLFLKLKDM